MLQVPERSTELVLAMAAFFDTLDRKLYDQSTFYDADTGASCICGWTNRFMNPEVSPCDIASDTAMAAQALGLDTVEANKLFNGNAGITFGFSLFGLGRKKYPKPEDAARCLRDLAVTGMVPAWWS